MKKQIGIGLILFALTVVPAMLAASGPKVTGNIPFDFFVAKAKYAAGQYEIAQDAPLRLRFTNLETKQITRATIVTRISARESDTAPVIIFDMVGSDHYLSEIHVPGQDGFLLEGAAAEHKHVAVKTMK